MPRGQPTKYNPKEHPRLVYAACAEGGFTDRKLVKILGVCKATINNWKKAHPEFLDQLIRGKDEYEALDIEKSLVKRAKGFRYTETTRERTLNPDYNPDIPEDKKTNPRTIMVITKAVGKFVPPDTGAIKFHLPNRNRERWSNVQNFRVGGEDGGPIEFAAVKGRKDLREAGDKLLEAIVTNGNGDSKN